MTRRRWIADEISGDHAALVGEHADHLARVLRAHVGQEFDVSTGSAVRRARITAIGPERVEFALGDEIMSVPAPDVTLFLSIFKFDRMEWAIEKVTELGISRIVPLIARRTDAHLASAAEKRAERWRRIVRQASEQSRRNAVPEIADPVKIRDMVSAHTGLRILLAETEEQNRLPDVFAGDASEIALAVGPEGGWTEEELGLFREAGWLFASLGSTILRAETAAIAAVAVVTAELSR